jgi:hypothetical protein
MTELELIPSDNHPVLVKTAPLPNLREQAVELKVYLADDANVFGAAWLEEQQRRLEAVYSYIKDRAIKAEVSHCQRWVELRIGEWLGPAKPGDRTDLTLSPGDKVEIHPRHKHEFRLLAENRAVCLATLEKYEGEAITRAALIAEIQASNLREHSSTQWSEEELARREQVKDGITVVATLRGARDKHLINWAESNGLLVRVDRNSEWGTPYETPADGDRDTVCDHYILHLALKSSLANKIRHGSKTAKLG